MRIVWLYGPPGVGKSVTAWELYRLLTQGEECVGYLDIDQLGMASTVHSGSDAHHELKARALASAAQPLAERGVRTLVVSGVVGPSLRPLYRDLLHPVAVTFARLVGSDDVLRERLASRREVRREWADVIAYARRLDDEFVRDEPAVPTDLGTPQAIAQAILARQEPGPVEALSTFRPALSLASCTGDVLVISGTRAVGKSAVAWRIYTTSAAANVPTAMLDLQQLAIVSRASVGSQCDVGLAVARAVWSELQLLGCNRLVLNGSIDTETDPDRLRHLFRATRVIPVRLTATSAALETRMIARVRGEGPRLAGHDLRRRAAADLPAMLQDALLQQERQRGDGWLTIDTTDLTVAETADRLLHTLDG